MREWDEEWRMEKEAEEGERKGKSGGEEWKMREKETERGEKEGGRHGIKIGRGSKWRGGG